ncbi:MAG: glycosyltransferase [Candidatus Aminicenantes bacterium]|jgi:glycosyltransferase involved in cell wall biosynthesis
MKEPEVTVLMAVHNDSRYIGKALRSILDQTFKNFEFLIIDDGSTDDSIEIIKGCNDPRIRLIFNGENMGLTRTLNRGLSLARARYIARMDADDISLPTRLQEQVDFFRKNPSYGLVGTNYRNIDEQGRRINEMKLPSTNREIKKVLLETNQFAHASVMFTAKAIEAVGPYREFFTYSQDYDLFLRISEKFDVYNLPAVLVEWRVRLNSASVKYRTLQQEFAQIALLCALERRKTGKDPVEGNEINGLPAWKFSRCKRRNIMAKSYYLWADYFYRRKQSYTPGRQYAARLILKSFLANPFMFLLLICKRLIGFFKRPSRLNAVTANHRENKQEE